jgi:uncharacterized protein with von Willebrand factor type A (vWA) domain
MSMGPPVIGFMVRELRARGVGVGMQEVVALAGALAQGLHDNSLDQFYLVARALLIHDESDLDEFDQVFSHVFKGVAYSSVAIAQELRDWLADPKARRELSDEERASLEEIAPDELLRMLEERLREQKERHDGGSYWVGTGGTSPFGTGGYHPSGISLRNGAPGSTGGGRSMIRSADARRYRGYRHDVVLDVRQIEVALRKLRSFDRDGTRLELDVDATVDATARNWGELEPVFRKPRRPNTRVILLMDVGGSMDPFAALASQLFSAAKRATHWRELRTYYFHNCVYSRVYRTEGLREPVAVRDLMRECDGRHKLIVVGDAAMAPYELMTGDFTDRERNVTGYDWLGRLRAHFPDSIWLNPDPPEYWRGGTAQAIGRVFPMFRLSIAGLEEGLAELGGQHAAT